MNASNPIFAPGGLLWDPWPRVLREFPTAAKVYAELVRECQHTKQLFTDLTDRAIGVLIGRSRATVSRAMKVLAFLGLVNRTPLEDCQGGVRRRTFLTGILAGKAPKHAKSTDRKSTSKPELGKNFVVGERVTDAPLSASRMLHAFEEEKREEKGPAADRPEGPSAGPNPDPHAEAVDSSEGEEVPAAPFDWRAEAAKHAAKLAADQPTAEGGPRPPAPVHEPGLAKPRTPSPEEQARAAARKAELLAQIAARRGETRPVEPAPAPPPSAPVAAPKLSARSLSGWFKGLFHHRE
jgi:hypothetical protein